MNKFNCIALLDDIILSAFQWNQISKLTNSIYVSEKILEMYKNWLACNIVQNDANNSNNYEIDNLIRLSKEEVFYEYADAIVTCWSPVSDELLLQNKNLEYVGFWTDQINDRINVKIAKKRGITVDYVSDYAIDAVAELTFAGILAITRKLLRETKNTIRGSWHYELLKTGQYLPCLDDIPQRTLANQVLGIVGMGRIGQRVAEIANAYKMHIYYWSRRRKKALEETGYRYTNLDELFSESDIVTIHLSQNAPKHIISHELFQRMKEGAIFINTGVGSVVDENALFEVLESKKIYASIDVYDRLPPKYRLKRINSLDNLFTYRSGWFTKESIEKKGEYLITNLINYLNRVKDR